MTFLSWTEEGRAVPLGPSRVAIVLCLIALLVGTSCSRRDLSRPFAAQLIMHHEQERYDERCAMDFLASPEVKDPDLLRLRTKLGTSVCAYAVEVVGISLTSQTVRDVVFVETKTYDKTKLTVLSAYVDSLYARLSVLPVQAVADASQCREKNRRCSKYHFVVVDSSNGGEIPVAGAILGSVQEAWACDCYWSVFLETARQAARTKKLTVGDVWASLPSGLSRHQYAQEVVDRSGNRDSAQRVARFQLFDDGWRVLDVSPP